MERVICLLIGYVFGLLQTGYIYGKLHNFDIRSHGSGNAGSTNALRTMGLKAGLTTFLGDCFKGVLAICLVRMLFAGQCADMLPLLSIYAGFGAVMGHNYPFYLGFKGGKGIAATGGIILATDWRMAVLCLLVFILVVVFTKYVSVGSLVVSVMFLVMVILAGQNGQFGMSQSHLYEMYAVVALLMVSAFYRHKANIKRLCEGTENKISMKKKDK